MSTQLQLQRLTAGAIAMASYIVLKIACAYSNDLSHTTTDYHDMHACVRECSLDPRSRMTCAYNFTIEHYWVLSKACYDCPNVTADCSRQDCIAADGMKRGITTVNRRLPGPAIQVCEGDTVVVDVSNKLFSEGTAIHWHGIHMKNTPWMDGVPGVTQCVIPPRSTFRYQFDVPIGGTHYWHSHAGFQRDDGVFGSLVVKKPAEKEPNRCLYDFDLLQHQIVIWDWLPDMTLSAFLNHHHSDGDNKPRAILINGKGNPTAYFSVLGANETRQTKKPFFPLHELKIKQGFAYRIRTISNGILNCPLELSIENHRLEIIASDGFDLKPTPVHSLVVYAGERWDFILRGNQPIGSYWIKIRGLMDCDDRFNKVFQLAVLNYEGVPRGTVPQHTIKSWYESAPPPGGLQLNPLNVAPGIPGKFLTVADLRSSYDDDPEIIAREVPDYHFYVSYDFNPIDNIHFHGPHIPIRTVRKGFRLYTPQLNFISNIMPASPLLTQPETLSSVHVCNETSMKFDCSKEYCECTHVLKVKLNSIVEVVMVDRGYTYNANHAFHLHGHAFRVVGTERLGNSTEPWIVHMRDNYKMVHRVRQNAPIKDTVSVPDGGYTIIRFRADNPGYWLYHCHNSYHLEIGMALIFQVGELEDMPETPPNFPKCGNYMPRISK